MVQDTATAESLAETVPDAVTTNGDKANDTTTITTPTAEPDSTTTITKSEDEGKGKGKANDEEVVGVKKEAEDNVVAEPEDQTLSLKEAIASAPSPALQNGVGEHDTEDDINGLNGKATLHSRSSSTASFRAAQEQIINSLRTQTTDLSTQVTQLNSKLITSFSRVSDLEDSLHETEGALKASTKRLKTLQEERERHDRAVEAGLLVDRNEIQQELSKIMESATQESLRRGAAEKEKRAIEGEVEELSRVLFESANKMVAEARRELADTKERLRQIESANGRSVQRDGPPYVEYLGFISHLRTLHVNAPNGHPPPLSSLLTHAFVARLVVEDSDPTTRLDLAPALNWLSRRAVVGAIHAGLLSFDDEADESENTFHTEGSCAMCGKPAGSASFSVVNLSAPTPQAVSSPTGSQNQTYALCKGNYCLRRLRSTCSLWTFMRVEIVQKIWDEYVPPPPPPPVIVSPTPKSSFASSAAGLAKGFLPPATIPVAGASAPKPPVPPRRRSLWGMASAIGQKVSNVLPTGQNSPRTSVDSSQASEKDGETPLSPIHVRPPVPRRSQSRLSVINPTNGSPVASPTVPDVKVEEGERKEEEVAPELPARPSFSKESNPEVLFHVPGEHGEVTTPEPSSTATAFTATPSAPSQPAAVPSNEPVPEAAAESEPAPTPTPAPVTVSAAPTPTASPALGAPPPIPRRAAKRTVPPPPSSSVPPSPVVEASGQAPSEVQPALTPAPDAAETSTNPPAEAAAPPTDASTAEPPAPETLDNPSAAAPAEPDTQSATKDEEEDDLKDDVFLKPEEESKPLPEAKEDEPWELHVYARILELRTEMFNSRIGR